jgi:putative ABC transport system permease protein
VKNKTGRTVGPPYTPVAKPDNLVTPAKLQSVGSKYGVLLAFSVLTFCMFRNYLKVALRNIWRRKGYSFLNITGLSVGMASAILILLWIFNEVSYDRFHDKKDRIYQAWNRGVFDNKLQCWNSTPKILAPTLKLEFPEIESVARVTSRWFVTRTGDKKVSSSAVITDPAFLNIFTFPMKYGDPNTALDGVYSIVITEKMAVKMFGDEAALNKVITIDSNNYTVTGVLHDLPVNTQFNFELILPWSFMKRTGDDDEDWGNNSVETYVLASAGTSNEMINRKIKDVTIDHSNGAEQQEVFLHPLTKLYLYSRFENGKVAGGRIELVRLFGIVAAFILLIACINFMNLTTARSETRAKEVGIRKVAGAHRSLLIGQFLGESVLISLISGVIALMLVHISLPAFTELVNKPLVVPYENAYFWSAAVVFILITGAIAGSYPAFFLSSFKPVSVLKGTFKKSFRAVNPRKVLVVVQFSFAIILIICTFIIVQQIRHAQERDAGYDKSQLVYHWMAGDLYDKYPLVKSELLASGVATHVTKTSGTLAEGMSDTWGIQWKGKAANDKTDFDRFIQDEGLVSTAGLELISGRDMDLKNYKTDSFAMILNESAAKAMGFENPIGQIVKDMGRDFHVVGVVKDFVLGSPYQRTRPMVIEGAGTNWFNIILIRFSDRRKLNENLAQMEKIFTRHNPAYPFEFHFSDEDYATKFADGQRMARMSALFAILTIFISCLGLFGLASYMAATRIREIGIRKVLGASVVRITSLLSIDFIKLVVIAILIAVPLAWLLMNQWLQDFDYRIQIRWWIFALAAGLSLLIALLTVSYQAIRAANTNPTKSLRSE